MFIDIKEHFIFFFDSAANKTPIEMKRLVKRIMDQGKQLKKPIYFKYYENYPLEHQMGNTECGMYSLFFTITMITGKTDDVKFNKRQEKIDFFKKHRIPDKYVEDLRSRYFNP
jgi:thymidylate synthase ThyX